MITTIAFPSEEPKPEGAILPSGLITPVWTDDDLRVMAHINELWNGSGRKASRELKLFLREAKKHIGPKRGRPRDGVRTWDGFIKDLTAMNDGDFPCKKQIDTWISDLDKEFLYPMDPADFIEDTSVNDEEDEDSDDDEESISELDIQPAEESRRVRTSGKPEAPKKAKTKRLKVEDISTIDARFIGFKVSQVLEDGSFIIQLQDSKDGKVYEQTVTCDRPLEAVPEHLVRLNFPRLLPAEPTVGVFFGGIGMVAVAAQQAGCKNVFYSEWIPDEEGGNGGRLVIKTVKVPNSKLRFDSPELTEDNIMRLSVLLPKDVNKLTEEELYLYEEKKALYDREWARLEEEESKVYLSDLPEGCTNELPEGCDDESIAPVPTSRRPEDQWAGVIGEIDQQQLDDILKLSGLSLSQYVWMVEYQNAFATLVANNPEQYARGCLLNKDITKITKADLRKAGLRPGAIDIIQFSPPCQAFSDMNHWAGRVWDPRANLGFYALRICAYLLPKVIILENVEGLVHSNCVAKHREMFNVAEKNYYVKHGILNPAEWGCCQARNRLWWVGYRRDLGVIPTFPAPTVAPENFTTFRQVCPDVLGSQRTGTKLVRKNGQIVLDENGQETRTEYPYRDSDRPVVTILKKGGNLFNYDGEGLRVPKVSTLRAIFGVPEEHILVGTDEQKSERLGNAVIPEMARVLFEHLIKEIRAHQSSVEGTFTNPDEGSATA